MDYKDKNGVVNNSQLISYIEDTHHNYLRQALTDTSGLLYTILRVHGAHHRELYQLYRVFGKMKAVLEQHMVKEEILLFSDLDEPEENRESIIALTSEIIKEHKDIQDMVNEIREITNTYVVPADVCMTFEKTYDALKKIDVDLQKHFELENNELLKEYIK